mmetsp:Transcript_1921/g.5404  ORF Transcript_1921/g.5404 Transcript_1921/m.5404 type:complete len:607 (-) Transcript_1921:225-2045(-)|eukprot:CAMPEP_0194522110 /NCGR_PEP_ID=MMETSP0253-20130528/56582_1 /TAXON_ID=2966 /ORGANISM="Noctiluca scintillans" /LENGTH=606 /DNA_ID=CAMNT_0039366517 /DNA_START=148 /DNA_END=1968 /DNA_ORIENTATION=-
MTSVAGNELQVQVLHASTLNWPQNGIGARIGRALGSQSSCAVVVKLALSGHRDLFTHEHSAKIGDDVVTFERQVLTYKIRGVEERLVVSIYARHLDDDQAALQILLGEGQVAYPQDFEDCEYHLISVPICRNGVVSGAISLRVQLMNEVRPVTSAPAMSQEIVNNLYAAPHDVLNRIVDFFNVDVVDKDHGEKVDALVGVLDDIERRYGGQLTAIYEAELRADPDAAIPAPNFGRRAMTKIGNFISAVQVAPRFMIPQAKFVSVDTKEILVEWVKCRQEISERAFEIGNYLNTEGRILAGIGMIGDVAGISRIGFEVATLVCMVIPESDNIAKITGLSSVSIAFGKGILGVVTTYVSENSSKHKKRSIFQQVAQESALHRKAYFALNGGREDDEDLPSEDLPLEDLPENVHVDNNLQVSAGHIVGIVGKSFGLAQKSVGVASGIDGLVTAGKKVLGHNPSSAGKKMIELAKEYSYDGKPPEEVADMMIADPKRYVVAPPPGVIVFDVVNTSLPVRMVVRQNHTTQYFIEQEPVPLAGRHCEVSFQYELRESWHDIQQWDVAEKAFTVPAKKAVFKLNGTKDFRWFHLEGMHPIKVVSVDDEHGPMH